MLKRLVLIGLVVGLLLFGFGEGYSLMPKVVKQVTELQYAAGTLRKVLTTPNELYKSDSLIKELTGDDKKALFSEAKAAWLEVKNAYDSLQILIQAFDPDSLNGN